MLAFGLTDLGDDLLEMGDLLFVLREEEVTDGIFTRLRQRHALSRHLLAEEAIRDLHENAGAVTHQRIGTNSTAVGQIFQNEEAIANDLVRLLALHMGDEADAAGIVFVARIIETLLRRQTGTDDRRIGDLFRTGGPDDHFG